MTQREVAAGLGIRFQQIQKYECGGNRLSAERIWRLAAILDVPITYFFEGLDADRAAEAHVEVNPQTQSCADPL